MKFLGYTINQENLLKSLDLFWKGMLTILIAMAVIAIFTMILNVITKKKSK